MALIANIGAVQLVEEGVEIALRAIEMIEADAVAVHLNPLQELVQPGGRAFFKGVYKALGRLKLETSIPVIVKEIGCGLSGPVTAALEEAGVDAVDVAGSGGTNWT
jgi:isopentenyl-diphosphate delta-isomerase